jgi:hypothetical protein
VERGRGGRACETRPSPRTALAPRRGRGTEVATGAPVAGMAPKGRAHAPKKPETEDDADRQHGEPENAGNELRDHQ